MLLEERFWAKVRTGSGCWLWQGHVNDAGYGIAWDGHQRQRAHRMAYEYIVGPIPLGMFLLHRCDTPACVRPSHMFVGTQADNIHDMDTKGRRRTGTRDQWGPKNASAKLTVEQVADIRALRAAGVLQREIAAKYGISRTGVSLILNGHRWSRH